MRPPVLLIITLFTAACSGPFLWLPGGQLAGEELPLNLDKVPADAGVIQLETNPGDPYSVNVGVRLIDGQIYMDPAAQRQWYQHIQRDPNVRIRFDGVDTIHTAVARSVTDPNVLKLFEPDRIVLQLLPRS